jgi:L-asparaginase
VLDAAKPVVLTAAMRPATAPSPDGPQNLLDAVTLAAMPGLAGVFVAFGGSVYAADAVRKLHGYRVEAFGAGDAGPLARWQDGRLRWLRPSPARAEPHAGAAAALRLPPAQWPPVDIVTSHAGARATTVSALVAAGARGLVIAGTGNGSVHHELLAAARAAQAGGVRVLRASRCIAGGVVGEAAADALPHAGDATPAQARVRLLLELLASA